MIEYIIKIQKDSLGGTGAVFTLHTDNADQLEKDLLAEHLSEKGMTIAEAIRNSELKRLAPSPVTV